MNDYETWTRDEVAEWTGVEVAFGKRAKHREAVLTFGEQSRFVVYPDSPSDSMRGVLNHLATLRRELRAMGAVRNEQPKSTRPAKERNPGADQREMPSEPAPVREDPWTALAPALANKSYIRYRFDLEQGTDDWMQARCGLLCASEVKLILTPTLKIASNDKERAHVSEIAAQRISGYVEPSYVGDNILRGWEDEIRARDAYSKKYAPVETCGFITNERYGFTIGYSPDGLVGADGLIEAKSRKQKFQVETIALDKVPEEFVLQCQTALLVTEREWLDFISYSGGLPMTTIRVSPDPVIQEAIIEAAIKFETKVAERVSAYHARLASKDARLIPTERHVEQEMFV